MHHNEPARPSDELVLTALQYIGEELSEDARAAFEARLMNDQAAREAVASAVEVTLATRAAFADDAALVAVREEVRKPVSRRGWWNVALAASALAALVLVSKSLELGKRPVKADRAADLAMAWSEARAEWPTSALTDEQLAEEAEALVLDDDVALPSWMVAAVGEPNMNMEMSETAPGDTVPE